MKAKIRESLTALALVGALGVTGAKAADPTIQLETWWGGHGTASVTLLAGGVNYNDGSILGTNITESGGAGGFKTNNLSTGGDSFLSWCVDIFHFFSFSVESTAVYQDAYSFFDTTLSNADASRIASDLGKLATNHLADASAQAPGITATQNENAVAFQLAVWEIVNENTGTYGLTSGNFLVNSAAPSDGVSPDIMGKANSWLSELAGTTSQYNAFVWGVSNGAGGIGMQDVLVFAPVPEPEIYAMLGLGLGLLGWVGRRRKRGAA